MRTSKAKRDRGTGRHGHGFGGVFSILAGDTRLVKKHFFLMVGKGWFRNLMAHYGPDIDLFLDDLCGEVSVAFLRKHREGTLETIKNPDGFLFNVIKYQSIKENRHIERLLRFDAIGGELW
jgi:hypothetical protein